jgi:[ribosomal protein S5]-alanine N-acetyltransferase
MIPAAWLVARIGRFSRASLFNKSQRACASSLIFAMGVLRTSRLVLRPFRTDDIDRLAALMANPDFMRFSLGVHNREQTLAFLDKLLAWQNANEPSLFAMIHRDNGMMLGWCGFYHQQIDGLDEIEIGYRLHPDYWNQGLTTEAAQAVRDHAFRDLRLPRVISLIHPENIPSRRVAEKIGMLPEKQTTYRGFLTDVFALSRDRWVREHGAG